MTTLDYSFERRIQLSNDEAKEEGRQIGVAEGKQLGIAEGKQLGIAEGKQIGIAEGKQIGIAEGKQLGIAEGKQLGRTECVSLLSSAITKLKAGASADELIQEGIPADIVDVATHLL